MFLYNEAFGFFTLLRFYNSVTISDRGHTNTRLQTGGLSG
jgi:hypothetical protein